MMKRVPVVSVLLAVCVFGCIALAGRGSGGTYTLPAGNPVVSGTTITTSWANNTLNDIGAEITNSLDRQGRGAMLAPLALSNGTLAAPSLTFSSEPGTGLYRNGAGDIRATVAATDILKLQTGLITTFKPLTVTGLTTTDTLKVNVSSEALTVVSTTPNLRGLSATGNTTGAGVLGFGGATSGTGLSGSGGAPNGIGVQGQGSGNADGVLGYGGATSGVGVEGIGGGSSATGVKGTGGAPNGAGVSGYGTGTGSGVNGYNSASAGAGTAAMNGISLNANGIGVWGVGTGTYPGVKAVGGASGMGLQASAGTAATGGTRRDAVTLTNGDLSLDGVTAPTSTTAVKNRLTPVNIVKAFGEIKIDEPGGLGTGTASVLAGMNIASLSYVAVGPANYKITVNFAQAFASDAYAVNVNSYIRTPLCLAYVSTATVKTASSVTFEFQQANTGTTCGQSGGIFTVDWLNTQFSFTAIGAQ